MRVRISISAPLGSLGRQESMYFTTSNSLSKIIHVVVVVVVGRRARPSVLAIVIYIFLEISTWTNPLPLPQPIAVGRIRCPPTMYDTNNLRRHYSTNCKKKNLIGDCTVIICLIKSFNQDGHYADEQGVAPSDRRDWKNKWFCPEDRWEILLIRNFLSYYCWPETTFL